VYTPEGKRPLEDLENIKTDGVVLTGFIWLRIATSGGFL
jgi:hypothetical protein